MSLTAQEEICYRGGEIPPTNELCGIKGSMKARIAAAQTQGSKGVTGDLHISFSPWWTSSSD